MALYHELAKNLISPTLTLPRSIKRLIVLIIDLLLCVGSTYFAYYLRLGYWVAPENPEFYKTCAISIFLAIPIFYIAGLYRSIFRYSGLPALLTITKASFIYAIVFAAIFTVIGVGAVPRTVGLIQPVLLLLLVGLSRAVANVWFGGAYLRLLGQGNLSKVLIYGAGSAGRQLAAAMANSHEMQVVGFLDDDKQLQGNVINGLYVYRPENLPQLIQTLKVSDVLLAIPSVSRSSRQAIVEQVSHAKVRVRTLPSFIDIANGKVGVDDLHDLDIEDLMYRDTIDPDPFLLKQNSSKKIVLVTGSGGSIGGELCRQILLLEPAVLILIDHSEADLYKIHQELVTKYSLLNDATHKTEIVSALGSVTDTAFLEAIFKKWLPHIVYHAAAYKHVPIVEENPFEGIKNNVFGTLALAILAKNYQTPNFVLISTDKAVRPTNVMGVSKRLAELILQSFSACDGQTIFTMVRFGNVLASSGSVIPKFRQQIKEGGPVTVTDFQMTRYFMTISEAAQLVMQAGAIAKGGDVFLLDMGQPIKIVDLAKKMIELSGLQIKNDENPDGDIEIQEIGIRPGEKLYEELLISGNPQKTSHPQIYKSQEHFYAWENLEAHLENLRKIMQSRNVSELQKILLELVPEYSPQNLDSSNGALRQE
jgi:FlaA1/EpsC-like NDP-sugar epimerase